MVLFTLPTSRRVTQDWGQDFQWLNGVYYPNGFYSSIGWLGHNGIDYGCPLNDPVESVCDGVVEYVGPGNNHPLLSGGGNVVLIRNDEMQMRFEYLHLNQQNVYTGQRVVRGQVIAQSGKTGTSTAPHLHLGAIPVRPNLSNGYRGRVDPTYWLYGPSNPDYNGGIAAAGTITPLSEEDDPLAGYSREELVQIAAEGFDKWAKVSKLFPGDRNFIDHEIQASSVLGAAKTAVDNLPQSILIDYRVDGRNVFDSIKQVRTDVFGTRGAVDVEALAKSLASQLAAADVQALAAQLQITVKP